ncbi:MAG: T9SS type A sorting domain-containing protein [Flavobacterium sp.]|nr:T9SS type A sorting domain-containing protein [Flavobacterium sp.]
METLLHHFKHFYFVLLLLVFSGSVNGQCSITGVSPNASTYNLNPCTLLSGCGGVLYIGDGVNPTNLIMSTALNLTCLGSIQLIIKNNSSIDFSSGNDYLILASGSSIAFEGTGNLIGGSCNASERIYIGTNLIASCNGNAGADYSFPQLVSQGGYNIVNASISPTSACESGSFEITATPIPSLGATIKWYAVPSGGSPISTTNPYTTPLISTTTTYYVEAYYSSTGFSTPRKAVVATVNPLPTIITQPITQLDCEGASVNFTAVATGTGLTYTWQRKKPTDASFITIPVEGNISYPSVGKIKIDNVGSSQSPSGTQYQVVVTNSSGCSVTSSTATLLVNEIIGVTGSATVTQCYGTGYSYTVITSTPPPGYVVSYQWKSSVTSGVWNNVIDGTHFSGAITATLNILNGTPAESAGYRVYITFHSSGADCNVNSSSRGRSITFLPLLTASVSVSESANSICVGIPVTFTATPTNGGTTPTYQWKLNGSDVGANSTTPTYINSTLANGDIVTCEMTSNATCATGSPATSNAVTMAVKPILTSVSLNLNGSPTVCVSDSGTTLDIVEIGGATISSRQWGTRLVSGGTITPIGGASATTFTPGTGLLGGTWILVCTSTSTCGVSVVSNEITITVSTPPQLGLTQPTCAVTTGTITVTTPAPASGITYTLVGTSPTVAAVTNITGVFSGLAVGAYDVTVNNATCATSVTISPLAINTWSGIWSTGSPPTIDQNIVFSTGFSSTVDVEGCTCTVTSGVVTFNSSHTLKINNWVHVNGGSLTFENNASLVQINNVSNTNSGNIKYERQTTKITKMDYTYWSTPVLPFALGSVSPNTSGDKMYSYDSSIEDWKQESPATSMVPGVGYIVRGPQNFVPPMPASTYEAPFVGVPNNGHYEITGITADRSYLLGNPYPSALDADTFLDANQNVLDGTLYFWTHNTPIAIGTPNPGSGLYAYSGDDYASYNRTGGVSTAAPAPSSVFPYTGLNSNVPSGKIASGQGFFGGSKKVVDGFVSGIPIVYNNTMRVGVGGITGNNTQFFKTKNPKGKITTIEKHRIWLDLTNSQGAFKQTLIGYVTNASNEYEGWFDGESYDGNNFLDFYSVLQDKNLAIQGRALPFDKNDEVPLGYRAAVDGTFTMKIGQTDGVLSNQDVYIEDKLTNTIFDLKSGNYTFSTVAGTFNDRFVLRYKDTSNKTLGVDETDANDGIVVLYSNNYKTLIIRNNLKDSTVNSVTLFNMLGQKIAYWDVKGREQTTIQIPIKNLSSEIYIVKIKTTKGETSKKIVIK